MEHEAFKEETGTELPAPAPLAPGGDVEGAIPETEESAPAPGEAEGGEEEARFAELERADLAALAEAMPELGGLSDLSSLTSPGRYGELREAGLSPIEAYLATEGQRLLRRAHDTRGHLKSSVGRASGTAGMRLGASELSAARELFPALSDREIEALWRRVEHPRGR